MPLDVLGVNYYSTHPGPRLGRRLGRASDADGHGAVGALAVGGRRRRRLPAAARPVHGDGLEHRPDRADRAAAAAAPRVPRPAADDHRERRRVRRRRSPTDGRVHDDRARSTTCAGTSTRSAEAIERGRRRPRLLRLVAAGQLRVGATATTAASASSASTTTPRSAPGRTAPTGTATWSPAASWTTRFAVGPSLAGPPRRSCWRAAPRCPRGRCANAPGCRPRDPRKRCIDVACARRQRPRRYLTPGERGLLDELLERLAR